MRAKFHSTNGKGIIYELALKDLRSRSGFKMDDHKERRIHSFLQWSTLPVRGYYQVGPVINNKSQAWPCSSG